MAPANNKTPHGNNTRTGERRAPFFRRLEPAGSPRTRRCMTRRASQFEQPKREALRPTVLHTVLCQLSITCLEDKFVLGWALAEPVRAPGALNCRRGVQPTTDAES